MSDWDFFSGHTKNSSTVSMKTDEDIIIGEQISFSGKRIETNLVKNLGSLSVLSTSKETLLPILLEENLDYSLVKYFHQISGVIIKNGSYLSHVSIMARELKIPVVKVDEESFNRLREKKVILLREDGHIVL
jgi:phosphohistidine swiveling domain-containing protein